MQVSPTEARDYIVSMESKAEETTAEQFLVFAYGRYCVPLSAWVGQNSRLRQAKIYVYKSQTKSCE